MKNLNENTRTLISEIKDMIETRYNKAARTYMLDWKGNSSEIDSCYKIKIDEDRDWESINYYWIEFELHDKKKYKISMFYKDYDRSNGNIHVLPGPIQFWEYDQDLDEEFEFTAGLGIFPYPEGKWKPLLQQPYFWDRQNIKNEAEEIVKKFDLYRESNGNVSSSTIIYKKSSEFYSDVSKLPEINNFSNRENLRAGKGHWKNYALLKWYSGIDNPQMCISLFKIRKYGNLGFFAKYDETQEWTKMNEHGSAPTSPWKAVWNIEYDEKFEKK